jgi:hypothetical protein
MAERKKPLGFKTPAIEMQERFDEVRAMLDTKQTDWVKLMQLVLSSGNDVFEDLKETSKSRNPNPALISHLSHDLQTWTIMGLSVRLGIELTETHKRLASCEEAIEELKLRTK